ncbi:MAG: hypothetical protein ACI9LY_003051 [Arenicella sp.]|jgi:hypothetical protein
MSNTNNKADNLAISPINTTDISAVADFLHKNMNSRFSAEEWAQGLNACWLENAPNHGFMLRDNHQVVGVICAIYSVQKVNGSEEYFCNPHTWCVLEEYRSKSVPLVLAVIRQQGYHFTMFSPNKDGEKIFSYLGFLPLSRAKVILPHIPSLKFFHRSDVFDKHGISPEWLPIDIAKCYQDHQAYPWLEMFAFRSEDDFCLVIYKATKYKKLPCANVTYISNKPLFEKCWGAIKNHLLFKHGTCCTRVDQRFLTQQPKLSFLTVDGPARFYLSSTVEPSAVEYIYSELTAMNL